MENTKIMEIQENIYKFFELRFNVWFLINDILENQEIKKEEIKERIKTIEKEYFEVIDKVNELFAQDIKFWRSDVNGVDTGVVQFDTTEKQEKINEFFVKEKTLVKLEELIEKLEKINLEVTREYFRSQCYKKLVIDVKDENGNVVEKDVNFLECFFATQFRKLFLDIYISQESLMVNLEKVKQEQKVTMQKNIANRKRILEEIVIDALNFIETEGKNKKLSESEIDEIKREFQKNNTPHFKYEE